MVSSLGKLSISNGGGDFPNTPSPTRPLASSIRVYISLRDLSATSE